MTERARKTEPIHFLTLYEQTLSVRDASEADARKGGELVRLREQRREFRRSFEALRSMERTTFRGTDQIIKTLIDSGRIREAEKELAKSRLDRRVADHQRARVLIASGDFLGALPIVSGLLSTEVLGVTRLSLLQMRANVLLELGDPAAALRDLDSASSLIEAYPKSPVGIYCEVLRIRALARRDSLEEALAMERELWKREFHRAPTRISADVALTLFRLRIDLKRLRKLDTLSESLASAVAARACGDLLYEALAALDIYFSVDVESRDRLRKEILRLGEEFARVGRLYDQVEASKGGADTGKSEGRSETANAVLAAERGTTKPALGIDYRNLRVLVPVEAGVRISIPEWEVRPVKLSAAVVRLALAIGSARGHKYEVFAEAWDLPSRIAHRYDPLFRQTLRRLREQADVQVSTADGEIHSPDAIFF